MKIEVPGLGKVEFPDDLSEQERQAAIEKLLEPKQFFIPVPDGTEMEVMAPTREEAVKKAQKQYRLKAKWAGGLGSVASGASFGWNDEITGFVGGLKSLAQGEGFEPGYTQARDLTRKAIDIFGEDHPVIQFALEMGGGILSASSIMKALSTLFPKLGVGTIGVGEGVVSGAGTSEGDTAGEIAADAAAGGVTGGLLAKGGEALADVLPSWLTGGAREGSQAQEIKKDLLEGRTPEQAQKELEELNQGFDQPWATYGDVVEDPTSVRAAVRTAESDQSLAYRRAMEQRQRKQAPLLEQSARDIADIPPSRTAAEEALITQRRLEGKDMYSPLRGEPVTVTPQMAQTLLTKEGGEAAERALGALRTTTRNPDLKMEEAQRGFDFWHNYQQVLRDMGKNKLAAKVPLSSPEGTAVMNMRDDVMSDLFGKQDWGEAYQRATARFKENSQLIEALTDSEKFMSMPRDRLKAAVDRLKNEDEQLVFAAGVVNDLIEKTLRNPDTADLATKMIRTPAMRENLSVVMGEAKMNQLDETMQRLAKMTQTYREATEKGTFTTPLREKIDRWGGKDGGAMTSLANFQFGDALRKGLGLGAGDVSPQMGTRALDVVRASSADELAAALAELEQRAKTGRGLIGGITGAGLTGAGMIGYPFGED